MGELANTKAPDPVSSVTAVAKLALDGVAKKVATPVPNPDIPVDIGNPVALVSVPLDGVPNAGVVRVGEVRVLFVSVSVVALPTNVSVLVGSVNVPVLLILEIIGVVKVLFVSVAVPVVVTTLVGVMIPESVTVAMIYP